MLLSLPRLLDCSARHPTTSKSFSATNKSSIFDHKILMATFVQVTSTL